MTWHRSTPRHGSSPRWAGMCAAQQGQHKARLGGVESQSNQSLARLGGVESQSNHINCWSGWYVGECWSGWYVGEFGMLVSAGQVGMLVSASTQRQPDLVWCLPVLACSPGDGSWRAQPWTPCRGRTCLAGSSALKVFCWWCDTTHASQVLLYYTCWKVFHFPYMCFAVLLTSHALLVLLTTCALLCC